MTTQYRLRICLRRRSILGALLMSLALVVLYRSYKDGISLCRYTVTWNSVRDALPAAAMAAIAHQSNSTDGISLSTNNVTLSSVRDAGPAAAMAAIAHQSNSAERISSVHSDAIGSGSDTYWRELMTSIREQPLYSGPSDILINTYMRSGSTFLGQMLGHGPDTFYWYEPLWNKYTWAYIKGADQLCHYTKPVCEAIAPNSTKSLAKSLTFLHDIFNCKFQNHTSELHPYVVSESGRGWDAYKRCKRTSHSEAKCIHVAEESCNSSSHKVTKVLRLDLRNVRSLLAANPRLKVLQLFRDPRGVMSSHIRCGWYPVKTAQSIDADANVLCSRMRTDLTAARELMQLLPGRVKIVQYEDFIDFDTKTKILAQFLGLNFSGPNEARVKALNRNKATHLTRTQIENKMFSYRSSLKWEHLQIINKHCKDIYDQLGLPNFTDIHDYRHSSRPLITQQLPFALTN